MRKKHIVAANCLLSTQSQRKKEGNKLREKEKRNENQCKNKK